MQYPSAEEFYSDDLVVWAQKDSVFVSQTVEPKLEQAVKTRYDSLLKEHVVYFITVLYCTVQ
jgi:hypothetical protein